MKTETEIGVTLPQTKEHLEPPGAIGSEEQIFPRRPAHTLISNFRPPLL